MKIPSHWERRASCQALNQWMLFVLFGMELETEDAGPRYERPRNSGIDSVPPPPRDAGDEHWALSAYARDWR